MTSSFVFGGASISLIGDDVRTDVMLKLNGAAVEYEISKDSFCVVVTDRYKLTRVEKQKASRYGLTLVTQQWVEDCVKQAKLLDVRDYLYSARGRQRDAQSTQAEEPPKKRARGRAFARQSRSRPPGSVARTSRSRTADEPEAVPPRVEEPSPSPPAQCHSPIAWTESVTDIALPPPSSNGGSVARATTPVLPAEPESEERPAVVRQAPAQNTRGSSSAGIAAVLVAAATADGFAADVEKEFAGALRALAAATGAAPADGTEQQQQQRSDGVALARSLADLQQSDVTAALGEIRQPHKFVPGLTAVCAALRLPQSFAAALASAADDVRRATRNVLRGVAGFLATAAVRAALAKLPGSAAERLSCLGCDVTDVRDTAHPTIRYLKHSLCTPPPPLADKLDGRELALKALWTPPLWRPSVLHAGTVTVSASRHASFYAEASRVAVAQHAPPDQVLALRAASQDSTAQLAPSAAEAIRSLSLMMWVAVRPGEAVRFLTRVPLSQVRAWASATDCVDAFLWERALSGCGPVDHVVLLLCTVCPPPTHPMLLREATPSVELARLQREEIAAELNRTASWRERLDAAERRVSLAFSTAEQEKPGWVFQKPLSSPVHAKKTQWVDAGPDSVLPHSAVSVRIEWPPR